MKMKHKELYVFIFILNVSHLSTAPSQRVCPQMCECPSIRINNDDSERNCTSETFQSAVEEQGNLSIYTLTITNCIWNITDQAINTRKLITHCPSKFVQQKLILLFKKWTPALRIIENIYNNKTKRFIPHTNTTECSTESNSKFFECIFINKNNKTIVTKNITFSHNLAKLVVTNSTLAGNKDQGNHSSMTGTKKTRDGYRYQIIVAIASVSAVTLLVNIFFIVKTCVTNKANVIDCFGVSLMCYNILLAFYGAALSIYLMNHHTVWGQRFCQGITSMKLFALGASVWTFVLLTCHRSIRGPSPNVEDAIFKSIVYILEGLMISGVLAVMSWVKLNRWDYLCVIYKPKTTVEWLLTGIEQWHFLLALILIIRYPIRLCRKEKGVDTENKSENRGFPIFFLILVCFLFWVSGYIMTLPWVTSIKSYEINAAIRVISIILPQVLQPIIYVLRNTCCFYMFNTKKGHKESSDHSVLLVCECKGGRTCPACESDQEEPLIRYSDTKFTNRADVINESNGKLNRRNNETSADEANHKVNNFASPKAIMRSPHMKAKLQQQEQKPRNSLDPEDASKEPLLQESREEMMELPEKSIYHPTSLHIATDSTPLLDDTDGIKRIPPKATPESTPVKRSMQRQDTSSMSSPSEYPSFISLDVSVNTQSNPLNSRNMQQGYEAMLKIQSKQQELKCNISQSEESRKSRGPTFYPLEEQENGKGDNMVKHKQNEESMPSKEKKIKQNNKNSIKTPPNQQKETSSTKTHSSSESATFKDKKKKKSNKKQNSLDNKNKQNRSSNVSLEWDHSFSYSDSSNSSHGCGLDALPDAPTWEVSLRSPIVSEHATPKLSSTTDDRQMSICIPDEKTNGIQPSSTQKQRKQKEAKDYPMEWDPSGCQIKPSPELNNKDAELRNNRNSGLIKAPEKLKIKPQKPPSSNGNLVK